MRTRLFEVVQNEYNLRTMEPIDFGLKNVKEGLNHKSIKRYGYVRHDQDTFTQHDLDEYKKRNKGQAPTWHVGDKKVAHWHVVCQCDSAVELEAVAKWFSVPVNQIQVPKGRDAFLDKLRYLTHEDDKQQELGKHRYEDDKIVSNFDWRTAVDTLMAKRLKFGNGVSEKDEVRYQVLFEGLTLRKLCETNPMAYQKDYSTLDKFRIKYISERAPMPTTRINYYVSGQGGVGKGLICRALARSLYPDLKNDEDIFFEVGAQGVAFEGYDGQPVLIWNDRRAYDLLQELNGRGNVFNVFDTHPVRGKQNVKYSSVNLVNEVNIVNSVQDYGEFLNGLAGEYTDKYGKTLEVEDKGQAYRRFPFIIPLHEKDFDLLMNKGFYEGTKEYTQYYQYKHIRGNMEKIAQACGTNETLSKELQGKAVKPIVDKHQEVIDKISHEAPDEAKIREQFKELGTISEAPTEVTVETPFTLKPDVY